MADDIKNPYEEARSALGDLKGVLQPIGPESSLARAQVKAAEAAALAGLAAADAMFAVRDELANLASKLER